MKILKTLLWLGLGLVVLVGGGGLLLPARSHLERSTTIERPQAEVFAMLDGFARFNEWSPWFAMDPEAAYSYSGPKTGKGARMSWRGDSAVGEGSQEIVASEPNGRIVNALDFGGSQATATFDLAAEGNATRVTWSMDSDHGFNPINRIFGAFFLERVVGKDYETGLAKLKTVLESGKGSGARPEAKP